MALILQAPFPTLVTSTYLPNPALGDSVNNLINVNTQRAIDGTIYTYIKTRDRQRLIWQFRLTYDKYQELMAFYQSYKASKIKVTLNFLDPVEVWVGFFITNPFEFEALNREEDQAIQIEFEGTKQ